MVFCEGLELDAYKSQSVMFVDCWYYIRQCNYKVKFYSHDIWDI